MSNRGQQEHVVEANQGATYIDRETLELEEDQKESEHRAATHGDPLPSMMQLNHLEEEIYQCAPGENNVPRYMLMDKDFEALAFPDCFPYGSHTYARHTRAVRLSWRQYFQQRLMNVDGRFAKNMEYLFCAQHISDIKQLEGDQSIALRMSKSSTYDGDKITAGMLRNANVLADLVRTEKAYKFMKNIRGSPAYWQSELYDVMAMLRQLGMPTFFLTLSAADLHWVEMITAIGHQIGRQYTRSEVLDMPIKERNELLKENPITAVRIFHHRVHAFFTHVICKHPTLKVSDYIIKIEFQARGSPHAHCILWVDGAPRINVDADEVVTAFIDTYITAQKPPNTIQNQHIRDLQATRQQHRYHSDYCRRNHVCRFGFPRPPAPSTIVARPLNDDDPEAEEKFSNATKIAASVLQNLKELQPDATLTDVLSRTGVTPEMYTDALKIAKKGTTIILKRNLEDMHTNACNLAFLHMWNANIDLQFIVDEHSTIMYVCSYFMKSEKEIGEFLQNVSRETQNESVKFQMKQIGKEFINKRVVGSPEAAMRVLSLPLIEKTRKVIFVNSNQQDQRVVLPKAQSVLQTMEDDDEDVFATTIQDRYGSRPTILADMCLAQFAVSYDLCSRHPSSESMDTDLDEDDNTRSELKLDKFIKLSSGRVMRKRTKPAILRVKRYKHETEPQQYYYSRLLLFCPWSTEAQFTETLTFAEWYSQNRQIIEENAAFFHQDSDAFDDIMASAHEDLHPQTAWDVIAPSAAALEAEAEDAGFEGMMRNTQYDEAEELEIVEDKRSPLDQDISTLHVSDTVKPKKTNLSQLYRREATKGNMTNEAYYACLQALNNKQHDIVIWNRMWCKNAIAARRIGVKFPAYKIFLSGSGGTGKSHVIRMLHRDIVHFFKPFTGPDIDQPLVLLTAPTGVAAFQIDGTTIHSAFNLSCTNEQGMNYGNMATMQVKLQHLELCITDEISMVSRDMFQRMNQVLCKVKGSRSSDWGNVCILAVGDLCQLEPVAQLPVYRLPKKPYRMNQFACLDWEDFQFHELTQNMRQKDKSAFATKLNSIRCTPMLPGSDEDLYFASCQLECDPMSTGYPINAVHLYAQNAHCAHWNKFKLGTLPGTIYTSVAHDGAKDCHSGLANVTMPDNPNKTRNLHKLLHLKKDAYVMLTTNLDVSDGLTNGARGSVVDIIIDKSSMIKTILVNFKPSTIGTVAKSVSAYKKTHPDAVPIFKVTATFKVRGHDSFRASRTQFPLCLAWAMTIHKCQGLTMPEVVVDMQRSKGLFNAGQAYVAFSRVTSKSGLHILNYDISQIHVSPHISKEMLRLSQCALPMHVIDIFGISDNMSSDKSCVKFIKLLHLNAPNILKKSQYMAASCQVQNAEIISLNETMLAQSQHIDASSLGLPPNMLIFRRDRNTNGGGVLLAVDKHLHPIQCKLPLTDIEIVAVQTTIPSPLCVISVYRPPWQLVSHFLQQLTLVLSTIETSAVCIVGDFNEDIFVDTNQKIQMFFLDRKYKQSVSSPTRDSGTLIDHVYTRYVYHISTHVSDCFFSDHDFVSSVFSLAPLADISFPALCHDGSEHCLLCLHPILLPVQPTQKPDATCVPGVNSVLDTARLGHCLQDKCKELFCPPQHEVPLAQKITPAKLTKCKRHTLTHPCSATSAHSHRNLHIDETTSYDRNTTGCAQHVEPCLHGDQTLSTAAKHKTSAPTFEPLQHLTEIPVNADISLVSHVMQEVPVKYTPLTDATRLSICTRFNVEQPISPTLLYDNVNTLCIGPPMHIKVITGDGHCLFRAISFLVTGYEDHHKHIRKLICDHIACGYIDDYINTEGSTYLHSTNMRHTRHRAWGTDAEIYAGAQLFRCHFFIYHIWGNQGHKWLRYESKTTQFADSAGAIFLDNRSSNHFNAVMGL